MKRLNLPFKIVFTGPESSGKTILAGSLAQTLESDLVPEFSRPYLAALGRKYGYEDLKHIAAGQKNWEKCYEQRGEKALLICDTDWTVIRVWELYGFGSQQITAGETLSPNTYYFLCAPDLPWEPDPLREHPNEREALFDLYHELLKEIGANFTVLRGDIPQRITNALAIIQNLY